MWDLDCEESWVLKNWCFWTVVLEKTLESLLDCKEIQQVHPKGDQSWVFIGRTDAEAETPILWPPHEKSWLIGKDPDAGRDWGHEEKRMTQDEVAGCHHWLDAHESGWTPGVGDGQGGLACCDSWGCKESDTTEWLNWTELKILWNTFYFTCEKTETLGIVIIWLLKKQLTRWDKLHKNFVKGNMCERKYEKICRRWGEKPDYNTSLTQDEEERERKLSLPIV